MLTIHFSSVKLNSLALFILQLVFGVFTIFMKQELWLDGLIVDGNTTIITGHKSNANNAGAAESALGVNLGC